MFILLSNLLQFQFFSLSYGFYVDKDTQNPYLLSMILSLPYFAVYLRVCKIWINLCLYKRGGKRLHQDDIKNRAKCTSVLCKSRTGNICHILKF